MPTIDILSLMAGDQVGILSSHLAIAGGGAPIYPWLNGPAGEFWEMKNAAGWPADGYTFDANWIYQTVTEVDDNATDYLNPKTYKSFVKPVPWMPRTYTPGSPEVLVQNPSDYVQTTNGVPQPAQNLGGPVMTGFSGPWNDVNFGGVVVAPGPNPNLPYYLQRYFWGAGFANMETNAYIPGYGRVRWQLFKIVNGVYTLSQTSLFNTQVSGPCPKLTFTGANL